MGPAPAPEPAVTIWGLSGANRVYQRSVVLLTWEKSAPIHASWAAECVAKMLVRSVTVRATNLWRAHSMPEQSVTDRAMLVRRVEKILVPSVTMNATTSSESALD